MMVNLHYPVRYSISTLLSVLVLLRVYLPLRMLVNSSIFASVDADLDCRIAVGKEFKPEFTFALKGLMKQRPYFCITVNFALSVACFGLAVRAFER